MTAGLKVGPLAGLGRVPDHPSTPYAAAGELGAHRPARSRGGPVASQQWCGPCRSAGGAGSARHGRACAPSRDTLGEGSPPRRKVDRSADDIALNTYRLELSEGKPPIADQGCVICQLLVGSLEQACL